MRPSLFLFAILWLATVTAAGEETGLRRWAIIASEEVAASGLQDLLTVQLSQDESVHMVERERLRDAMRELQLATLLQAVHVDERLHLGKVLGADALMVLHHIIAVPPFLCENFAEQFDYLQSWHSDVLSDALMVHAGVAVVEFEESQAILQELEDTFSSGLKRPIATIVEGRYRVAPPDATNQRRIELQIELVRGRQREQIKKSLSLATVGHWLTTSLTERLLSDGGGDAASLAVETQKAILARHAQRFAELGRWERSIPLREAALVLQPNDALQRGLLISEYQYKIARLIQANWHSGWFAKKLPPEARALALQQVSDDYRAGLNHLAYLVRNRLVHRADAIGLFQTHRWYKRDAVGPASASDPLKHEMLQSVCAAQREFVRELGDEINRLSPGRVLPERLSSPFYGFQYALTHHVLCDVAFNDYSAASVESLRDLLERIMPPDAKVSAGVLGKMRGSFTLGQPLGSDEDREKRNAHEAWRIFLQELRQSDRDAA